MGIGKCAAHAQQVNGSGRRRWLSLGEIPVLLAVQQQVCLLRYIDAQLAVLAKIRVYFAEDEGLC